LSLGRVSTGRLREEDFFVWRQRCLRPSRPERVFGDRSPSTTASFGEHFAAWEQPKFAEEIRARFRSMPVDETEVEARRNHLRFQNFKIAQGGYLSAAVVAFGLLHSLGELGVSGQQLEQLQLIHHSAELRYRFGSDLPHHVAAMDLHRSFGDAQLTGNLLV